MICRRLCAKDDDGTRNLYQPLQQLPEKAEQHRSEKIVQAVRAAMTEAGTNGMIESLPRTKHGESRLKNVEKFDLPDAYRLVVQLVDGVKNPGHSFL